MNAQTEDMRPIPKEVLAPLARNRWMTDEHNLTQFDWGLECHDEADRRDGLTCQYIFHDGGCQDHGITSAEFKAMRKRIPEDFRTDTTVNQHYLHSLMQFYSQVQKQWDAHVERTQKLIGTPAGRICRGDGQR